MTTATKRENRSLLITVNTRDADCLIQFIGDLSNLRRFSELAVRIVDNASGDDSVPKIRAAIAGHPNVALLESSTNRGYFGAARLAYDSYLRETGSVPQWTIVCNNDMTFQRGDFLERLFDRDIDTIGVIGPHVISLPLRLNQNPFFRKRPSFWKRSMMRLHQSSYWAFAAWEFLSVGKRRVKSWWPGRSTNGNEPRSTDLEPVYAIHGAFFIFSRKYFESGGYLDDQLFFYGEELAVAEICRRLSLPSYYDPTMVVFHNEHTTSGKRSNRLKFRHYKNAMQYALGRYLTPK